MKYIFLLSLFSWKSDWVLAQKKIIDSSIYGKWPTTEGQAIISNDGKYVAYDIRVESNRGKSLNFIIQSTQTDWDMEFPNAKYLSAKFTSNSKNCLFINDNDSLVILDLVYRKVSYIPNVSEFSISNIGSSDWVFYAKNDEKKSAVLYNTKSGIKKMFEGVTSNFLSETGETLILVRTGNKLIENSVIDWIDVKTGDSKKIWEGNSLNSLALDFKHQQLAFLVGDSIWYYRLGTAKAICASKLAGIAKVGNLKVISLSGFNSEGSRLYVNLLEDQKNDHNSILNSKAVKIWSYRDENLQPLQSEANSAKPSCKGIFNLKNYTLIQLQYPNDQSLFNSKEDLILVPSKKGAAGYGEQWNSLHKVTFFLVNANNGGRKELSCLTEIDDRLAKLSPSLKYVLYYDRKKMGYFSHDLASDKTIELTSGLDTYWLSQDIFFDAIAGWVLKEDKVLVYDKNDIWKLDLSGKSKPINLTNGYGKKHDIIFNLINNGFDAGVVPNEGELVVSAFNRQNKENGFFRIKLDKVGDPQKISMGSFIYKINSGRSFGYFDFTPIKARDKEIYLAKRQSATDAPNYFCTTDFKNFKRLSNLHPQLDYNWYTSELHHWKSLDGKELQGILYKPENFDPKKRYPVIFYYYQELSDGLNVFLKPSLTGSIIDIPKYVSNGYLVFCPDIIYTIGDPMQGTHDALVSAAKYLSGFPFVNKSKMGIQGHSWGGIQTNSLVTTTDMFAAACSSSGTADWISGFNSMSGEWYKSYDFEIGQYRMGGTPWNNLDGYLKNSPIIHADKVTTPLLMTHGMKDRACSFTNAFEFFLALRRLGKKAWMLGYPEAGHVLSENDASDQDVRMKQFFDHYLMDKPAPNWMLDGNPPPGNLSLDTTGRTPGTGLLTPEKQKKTISNVKETL